ncbi:helix-turn-helix domain-containing protein [Bifidobacterium platyrrhinorum]|uniref:Helix-turn-helix domain-containing protein n=1 Tax=Bifidobacterium platyrrhinorum TaxID=2661628 RepID=A0A6L9SSA2_9BIFI|nr:helix-turn-helix transcriptional regulator [Bifidobacterium platyrrhinorum]NEG55456.1 helix-turn-helix domain-containing protein [Bifidobacterium platyrrhinorum]
MGIRELREDKGLKQPQFAEKAGVSQQRLSEYEVGKRPAGNMKLDTALEMLRAGGHARLANNVARLLIEGNGPKENTDDSQV